MDILIHYVGDILCSIGVWLLYSQARKDYLGMEAVIQCHLFIDRRIATKELEHSLANGVKFQPKGSMCLSCIRWRRVCSNVLDFSQMPVIQSFEDGTKVVRCTGFERGNAP